MKVIFKSVVALMFALVLVLVGSGCGSQGTTGQQAKLDPKKDENNKKDERKDDTSEDGWWCIDHGIPELECSMCQADVEKKCRANNDWCEKHNRARSQCFKCEPGLKAKFDAMYREHYKGQEPPPIKD
jgi:hypothetical protein